jgi:hypothetical protein
MEEPKVSVGITEGGAGGGVVGAGAGVCMEGKAGRDSGGRA